MNDLHTEEREDTSGNPLVCSQIRCLAAVWLPCVREKALPCLILSRCALSMWRIQVFICLFHQLDYFNSIQDYLYSAFHETIAAKQLYRKFSFYNRFIYCRNLIYLTYGKIWLILYILWGVGITSSQVFGHLRSFSWLCYSRYYQESRVVRP